jgi:hypothetical protein
LINQQSLSAIVHRRKPPLAIAHGPVFATDRMISNSIAVNIVIEARHASAYCYRREPPADSLSASMASPMRVGKGAAMTQADCGHTLASRTAEHTTVRQARRRIASAPVTNATVQEVSMPQRETGTRKVGRQAPRTFGRPPHDWHRTSTRTSHYDKGTARTSPGSLVRPFAWPPSVRRRWPDRHGSLSSSSISLSGPSDVAPARLPASHVARQKAKPAVSPSTRSRAVLRRALQNVPGRLCRRRRRRGARRRA